MDSFAAILIFAIGGLASAAFYTPLRKVGWSWEIMWIFYIVTGCILCPMIIASLAVPGCWAAIGEVEGGVLIKTFLLGAGWGVGGLTFGLSMRYLGIGLGTAVALGFCMLVGTLFDPLVDGKIGAMVTDPAGFKVIMGVVICALGIGINGIAGIMKDADTASADAPKTDFNLSKGFAVAIFAGVMSACMALSMKAGAPIAEKARIISVDSLNVSLTQAQLFQNSAILIVTLMGGFLSNIVWCAFLAIKNKSFADFTKFSAPKNLLFVLLCLLGGGLWYMQFFMYGIGMTKLAPEYAFASWGILMAFIIVFAGVIGLALGEWKGTKPVTKAVLWMGILVLAASTFIMK